MRFGRCVQELGQRRNDQRPETASNISVAIIRGGSVLNRCVPFFNPPKNSVRPKTSSELPSIEPTRAACTTLAKPARSANMETNSWQITETRL